MQAHLIGYPGLVWLLLSLGCAPCPGDLVRVDGECTKSGGGTDTGTGEPVGDTVVYEETFDGPAADWTLSDGLSGGADCALADGAYSETILIPLPDDVPYCYLTLDRPLDLSPYTEAAIHLDYDASHYADAGGPDDGASIGFSAHDGDVDDWRTLAWSASEGEDAPRTGTATSDLTLFAGWSTATRIEVRLALYACPNEARGDCGVVNVEEVAALTVDHFVVTAR